MTTQILQAGEIPTLTNEPPFAIAPVAETIFGARATRFDELATGHSQGDWLRFLGALSRAQHEALQVFPAVPLPDAAALEQAAQHMMPPLPANAWSCDPAWQATLHLLVNNLQKKLPGAARVVGERLKAASSAELEALATRTLDLAPESDEDRAASLFVAAALQVYWTAMASRLAPDALARLDTKGVCPCCGSLPVASVVRVGGGQGEVANLRYLHCSLCNTQWNLVRVACAACDDNGSIAYQSLEGHYPAVRAETCEACHGYLKILYPEKDPAADPVADDLATAALDLLLDEAGYERTGPNLFLLAGA